MTPHTTLYEDLIANGVEVHHWQSDLYVPISDLTREIRARHPEVLTKPTTFKSQVDGKLYWDFFAQYDPFWLDVNQKEKTASLILRNLMQEGFEFPDACAKAAVSYGVSSDRLRQIYDGDHL